MKSFLLTMLSIVLIAGFAACSGNSQTAEPASSNPQQSSEAANGTAKIAFPAYEIEDEKDLPIVDMVNTAPTFQLSFPLQENWKLETEKKDETIPTGEFYTPVYIYESDKLIGYIGFSPFVFDVPDDTPKEGAYPLIFPNLRMSSQFQWDPYTAVKETDHGEVGVVEINYMDPNDIPNHPGAMPEVDQIMTTGILTYDMELKVSVGIAFMPGTISMEQAAEIAKEVEILPE